MARHRDVRNRQFSFDEGGDEDFYDEEEEDRLIEEHRLQTLQARGDAGGRGGGSGGISLSSYFDGLPGSTAQLQQQQRQPRQQDQVYGGTGGPGPPAYSRSDQPAAGGGAEDDAVSDADAELVAAIAAELEKRLEKGRFSAEQLRQAVQASGYEVDTAAAILLSDETSTRRDEPQVQFATANNSNISSNISSSNSNSNNTAVSGGGSSRAVAPPPGLPTLPGTNDYGGNSLISSLAFGLCVDGRPGAANTNTSTGGGATSSSSTTGIISAASTAAAAAGLERFGFDTPSPDDVNLFKQAAARGGGIGSSASGSIGGGGGGRKTDAAASFSPKAKVVHISGSTPKTTSGRKTAAPGTPSTAAAAAATATTPTPTKSRGQPSSVGSSMSSPSLQQSAAAEAAALAIDESDDALAGGKERLAMVVIGHVDAGKSTLMGQVLVQVGQVSQRALHKQEKEAREAGKASFFLAWVMDEDQEERAHGVTIEVAQKYIETETKLVTLLDAPGHRDFIPKMISGASAADAAVLVTPAAIGEFESGFQANGQTKEHAMLAKALGVNQLLVVVNKLDATDPPWSEERYEAVKAEVGPFLTRTGFRPKKVRFVPASGLSGENVSKRTEGGTLSSWYDGPTLLEAIDSFQAAPKATDKPFRMCVADVTSSGKGVSVSGRVVQGRVRAGDKVVVMPLEDPATAARLERNGAPARAARAGDNTEVTLSGVDPSRVVVGNVLCKAGGVLQAVRRFNAQIVALPALEVPIIKGTEFQLHMHNLDVMVHCSKLVSLTNTAGAVLKARPRCVPTGSTAHIRITCQRPICLEKYGECRALGRFVLRQKGATVAVGLVLDTEIR
ncbi:unnamed protein product [Pylaiella littoralis]